MGNRIISKFGGSSMANADAIRRSASVAKKQTSSVVVVSATFGTTNQILNLVHTALNKGLTETEALFLEFKNKRSFILIKLKEGILKSMGELGKLNHCTRKLKGLIYNLYARNNKICIYLQKNINLLRLSRDRIL